MSLAIFDIDGTIVDSNAVDNQCFLETFAREFGIDAAGTDWSDYSHHTDRGLAHEFLRRAWSRDPEEVDIVRHRSAFMRLLRERANVLHEIAGAKKFIQLLRRARWTVALATGAWSESAALKLGLAGFPADLPLVCCDTYASREDIVRHAIGSQQPSNIVVFGDGWWDVRTARNLGLPFIGVASGSAAEGLRRAGATEVILDFSDAEMVLAAMQRARPPELD